MYQSLGIFVSFPSAVTTLSPTFTWPTKLVVRESAGQYPTVDSVPTVVEMWLLIA